MPTDQCPDCGATFRPGPPVCPACGTELPGGEPAVRGTWLPQMLELAQARARELGAADTGSGPYILLIDETPLIFRQASLASPPAVTAAAGPGEEKTGMADYPAPHAGITGTPSSHPLLSLDDSVQARREAVKRIQQMSFWDRCQPPRPGGFAIEMSLAAAGFPCDWQRGIGVLLARREERPWPAETDPRTEEVFYIQYGPGPDDVCRWTNTNFYAVPPAVAVNRGTPPPA